MDFAKSIDAEMLAEPTMEGAHSGGGDLTPRQAILKFSAT
jgi:hypothetical protein